METALRKKLIEAQRSEIAEHRIYKALAARQSDAHNREILEHIAEDERRHYEFWATYTGEHPPARALMVCKYLLLARFLGITFAVKRMESGERGAQANYADVVRAIPEAEAVLRDEHAHENELTAMIDEERLRYIGSAVLGLSDALVELTGALAGFTLALQNNRLIALIGLITGAAAALSMAASEYLSTKEEGERRSPVKAAFYTGVAYVFTVIILVAPFLFLRTPLPALALTVAGALVIILAFSYYVSVAKTTPFTRRFLEMAGLSLGVAAISFGIGYVLRIAFGVTG